MALTAVVTLSQVTSANLIGFAAYQIDTFHECPIYPMAYLFEMQIRGGTSFRRHGFATRLMRELKIAAATAGAFGILLTVHLNNPAALAFYRATDFETSKISPQGRDYEIHQCMLGCGAISAEEAALEVAAWAEELGVA